MKVWRGYGSEHSADLVMIGRFKDAGAATRATDLLDTIREQVRRDEEITFETTRFSEEMLRLLSGSGVHLLGPGELDQFNYHYQVDRNGSEVVITTDEIDVSAFLKVMVDKGARVEVYSAHDYPRESEAR